jgi:hypothetical protein
MHVPGSFRFGFKVSPHQVPGQKLGFACEIWSFDCKTNMDKRILIKTWATWYQASHNESSEIMSSLRSDIVYGNDGLWPVSCDMGGLLSLSLHPWDHGWWAIVEPCYSLWTSVFWPKQGLHDIKCLITNPVRFLQVWYQILCTAMLVYGPFPGTWGSNSLKISEIQQFEGCLVLCGTWFIWSVLYKLYICYACPWEFQVWV